MCHTCVRRPVAKRSVSLSFETDLNTDQATELDTVADMRPENNNGKCWKKIPDTGFTTDPVDTHICCNVGRYASVVTILVTFLYLTLTTTGRHDDSTTTVLFLHLASFAAHFGAQFWVTFVAGFTMFFNLPRIMFGRLQSRLFPIYFGTTLMFSCVTFVTYTIKHPYETMTSEELTQLILLGACVVFTFINSFFLSSMIVTSMVDLFEMEKPSGIAFAVGYCDRTELKKDPKYCEYYRRFRVAHRMSGITNVITLVCNVTYMYHLACTR